MGRHLAVITALALVVGACSFPGSGATGPSAPSSPPRAAAIQKIQHVVVIMQENRSFDEYFGMFPGADGLPRRNGQFSVCLPDPRQGGCVRPYHDGNDANGGGPHGAASASADLDGGRMDGFVRQAEVMAAIPRSVRSTGIHHCRGRAAASSTSGPRCELPGYSTLDELAARVRAELGTLRGAANTPRSASELKEFVTPSPH